jgi:RimJ/RimL family protein N-acetyltransferase
VPHAIASERLRLLSLSPGILRASLAGDTAQAERLLGATLPPDWRELEGVLRLRLEQLERAPEHESWLTRAICLARERRVVGVIGFHGPPGGAWLAEIAPDGVEFGYTVFEPCRRRGYATEASLALMRWARDEHAVTSFVLSISPANEVSARVAARLGFAKTGHWTHETRGLEHVYQCELPLR